MRNDQAETLYATLLIFGILSFLLYTCVLRPLGTAGNNNNSTAGRAARRTTTATNSSNHHRNGNKPSCPTTRLPPHVSPTAAAGHSSSDLLRDNGIVQFRYLHAAASSQQQQQQQRPSQAELLADRARLLSRLLLSPGASSSKPPPRKGSTVVVAVPHGDGECPQLPHALYLLATYYNLIVLVVVDDTSNANTNDKKQNEPSKKEWLAKLRKGTAPDNNEKHPTALTSDILPDHRVVFTSSVAGRVAFCRQLQTMDLVLDFDARVQKDLERFGHPVTLYSPSKEEGRSGLGQALQ